MLPLGRVNSTWHQSASGTELQGLVYAGTIVVVNSFLSV